MRSIFTCALIVCALYLPNRSSAQNATNKNALSTKVNFLDYGLFYNQELALSQGFELGYFRNVHKYVNLGLPVKLGLSKLPLALDKKTLTYSADLIAQVSNTESTSKFLPFGFAGLGFAHDELISTHLLIPVGGGLHFKIDDYAYLTAQGEFRKAIADNNRDNFQASLGFTFLLHKLDPSQVDSDKDGVNDALDKCPKIAGTASALGCPDMDKDGVADAEDDCPTAPGPLDTNGCPDQDGDGVKDSEDACPDTPGTIKGCPDTDEDGVVDQEDDCPTVAGTWKGCPDTDLDGIPDKDDACPDQAGQAENNGCPERKSMDSDKDGFTDDKDDCPDQAGSVNGCPDIDQDGIADKNDQCPYEPGPLSNKGCPEKIVEQDTDGDGFKNSIDECPTEYGTVNGCPDGDGDGVPNHKDKCPTTFGAAENGGCPKVMDTDKDGVPDNEDVCPGIAGTVNGCPDGDKDGIADKDDLCPNEAGPSATKGCPDRDKDGFADRFDSCPDKAGTFEGCPDTDGDGTPDHLDRCPDKAGSTANAGCPVVETPKDSDGDGVPDNLDKCPNQKGSSSNQGCPEATAAKDTDGDGVPDDVDKCPTTKGPASSSGCPEIRKETKDRLAFAMQAVQFESGVDRLKGQSYSILDEIVEIMRQYPDYKLAIGGHTDNVGDEDTNFRLSTARAKACYDYFVFRGISANRLRYAGFGDLRPLADNETASGREINRRVEFELTLD